MRYAADTSVSSDRSKAEIEKTLQRYGADQFMSGWKDGQAAIQFRINGKMVRFILPLPDAKAEAVTHYRHGSGRMIPRSVDAAAAVLEQASRQRWRALNLAIKAKLEAVECGITTFEEEFFAHLVVPGQGGKTMGELMLRRIDEAYATGRMPELGWGGKS